MATYKNPPKGCEVCQQPIAEQFIDGATKWGPWGDMCPACHRRFGFGLGLGKGQLYTKQRDGRYLKTQG